MGYSFAYNAPVAPLLFARARNTLLLTLTSTLLAWCIALPFGVFSAAQAGRLADRAITAVTALLLVIPDIALALGLLMIGVRTRWFPTGGMTSIGADSASFWARSLDTTEHLFLPALILILVAQPLLVRHIR